MKINLYNIKKGYRYLKHYGWKEFKIRLSEKREPDNVSYEEWLNRHRIDKSQIDKHLSTVNNVLKKNGLKFAVIVLASEYNEIDSLTKESIYNQSIKPNSVVVLNGADGKIGDLEEDYFISISNGTILESYALVELLYAILHKDKVMQSGVHWESDSFDSCLIYSDCDIQGEIPVFKPDFSPHLQMAYDYISDIIVFNKAYYKCWVKNKCKIYLKNTEIKHLPHILGHIKKKDIRYNKVEPEFVGNPKVSIIIPNKDEIESLDMCLKSIAKSSYSNYEVIVVENNSKEKTTFQFYDSIKYVMADGNQMQVKIVEWKSDFGFNYSAINNYGISFASGEYIVLLNNDVEIITNNWIERMLGFCQQDDVGIVGAKLYYPDDTIQHAGIVVGVGGHARGIGANMLTGLGRYDEKYFDKTNVVRDMSAVTAACLMIKKAVFDEVGGFEEYLTVAFNDVDLCLKVRKKGYLIVFNPNVEAYHYESKSRGQEDTEEKVRRFQTEIEYMRTEWNDILRYGDPYYNPGYSRVKNDYSLNGMS